MSPNSLSAGARAGARQCVGHNVGHARLPGADHAGYELKQRIIEHLKQTGHEPIDCGALRYDADDDYPAFCIAAATRTVADPGSLGIVLGGSGNGEQIAANKVPGARRALA